MVLFLSHIWVQPLYGPPYPYYMVWPYLEDLGCLGTALLVVLGGLRGLDMAGGLVSLVVVVNLNEDSPLLRKVLGLEVGGAAVLWHQTG